MQARIDWVLKSLGTQVIKKKRPVRPVFPGYPSASYGYGGTLLCGVPTRNSAPVPSSTRNRNSTRFGALKLRNVCDRFWTRHLSDSYVNPKVSYVNPKD